VTVTTVTVLVLAFEFLPSRSSTVLSPSLAFQASSDQAATGGEHHDLVKQI